MPQVFARAQGNPYPPHLPSIAPTFIMGVRGHPFLTFSAMFCCHTLLSDVGPASWTALWPQSTPHVPWTLLRYIGLTYISCSYVPRSRLCLTADLVAWYCIVRVYTHRLSWLGVSLGLSLWIPPSRWVGPIMYLGLVHLYTLDPPSSLSDLLSFRVPLQ